MHRVMRTLARECRCLARLPQSVQRNARLLVHSRRKIDRPLGAQALATRRKDAAQFELPAAVNERFSKLQHTMSAAMRHAAMRMGKPTESVRPWGWLGRADREGATANRCRDVRVDQRIV